MLFSLLRGVLLPWCDLGSIPSILQVNSFIHTTRVHVVDCTLPDLHILINTIHSPSILNNSAAASWLPVCLPKFNASAFVNAYVMFLPRSDSSSAPQKALSDKDTASTHTSTEEAPAQGTAEDATAAASLSPSSSTSLSGIAPTRPAEIALVAVSGNANFEAVRGWCDTVSRVSAPLYLQSLLHPWSTHCAT